MLAISLPWATIAVANFALSTRNVRGVVALAEKRIASERRKP
jgi:hypothetical protein